MSWKGPGHQEDMIHSAKWGLTNHSWEVHCQVGSSLLLTLWPALVHSFSVYGKTCNCIFGKILLGWKFDGYTLHLFLYLMPLCLPWKAQLNTWKFLSQGCQRTWIFRRSVVQLQFWVDFLLPAVSQTENCLLVTHTESYMGFAPWRQSSKSHYACFFEMVRPSRLPSSLLCVLCF